MKNEESATLAQYIREKAELYRCSFNDLQWIVLYLRRMLRNSGANVIYTIFAILSRQKG